LISPRTVAWVSRSNIAVRYHLHGSEG